MNFIEAAIFILFLAIVSVPLALRFHLPLEIFLVIGSSIISLLLGVDTLTFDPVIVFYIFLPPILFAAAYFTSWRDFKFNLRPIAFLALGLVIFTAGMVATVSVYLIPGFTWAEGFLLGAIVSPPDAAAATSIIKKLGAPRRLISILEGESLVNDATALLLFRFSLIAVISGTFSWHEAIPSFFHVSLGGALVGLFIGFIGIQFIKRVNDQRAETMLTILIAFVSYLVAEKLSVSGVIATVAAGIYFGMKFPLYTEAPTRLSAKMTWDTLLFVINGFVFALIGLELPLVLQGLGDTYSFNDLFLYGFVVSVVVILCRQFWIYPTAYLPRLLFPSIARQDPTPSWQSLFVIGWTGMRGIVSLAAALSIPISVASRNLIMFVTYCVIVATLIPPALTLPILFRRFHLNDAKLRTKEEVIARLKALQNVIETVTRLADKEHIPCELLKEFQQQFERRSKVIQTQLEDTPFSMLTDEYVALRKLTIVALASERETLQELRSRGDIHDEVFHLISDELDIEELRSHSLRI